MNMAYHSLHHSRGMGFYCLLRRGFRDIVFGLLFLIILTGCSSSKSPIMSDIDQTGLTDSLPIIAPESLSNAFTATGILGAYDLIIDQTNMASELIPKRTSMIGESFIVNGTSFFVITPCQHCLRLKNLDYDDPYIKATFYASHPFEKGNPSDPPSPKNRLDLDIFDLALVVFPLEDDPTEPHLIDIEIYSESCGYPDGYTRELSEVIGNEFACPYFLVVDDSDTGNSTFNRFEMGTKDHTFDAWFAGGRFELYLTFGYGASTTFENRLTPNYFNPEFNRKAPWKVNVIPPAQGWPPSDDTETRDVIVEIYDWQIGATVDPNLDDPSDIYSQSDIVGVGVEIHMMTNELQIVTTPTGSHTGMPDDPLIFTVPISNENFLPGGYYQGYVKVLDSRVPPQAPFDGQTDSMIDVPDGVTLDFCSMPEFATYQIFTAEVWSNDPPFADLDVSDYFVDSGMPIQMWPGPATDDPDGNIVLYEYDFDYRSNYFSVDASNTTGAPVTSPPFENHEFGHITQQVAMRVTDDGYPPKSAIGVETITIYPLSSDRWARTWGKVDRESVFADNSGGVYVHGEFDETVDFDPGIGEDLHTANGYSDMFLSKFNMSGDFIWARTWGGNSNKEFVTGIANDLNGNLYLSGIFRGIADFDPGPGEDIHEVQSSYGWDIFLTKFNPDGDFIWARTWPGVEWNPLGDFPPFKVVCDSNDDLTVTGLFCGTCDFDPSNGFDIRTSNQYYEAFITRFSSNGDHIWVRTLGDEDSGACIQSASVDKNDNIYYTGAFSGDLDFDPDWVDEFRRISNGNAGDVFVAKYTRNLDPIWVITFGSEFGEMGRKLSLGGESFYLLSKLDGDVDMDPGPGEDWKTRIGGRDTGISKFDTDGNYEWGHRIGVYHSWDCMMTTEGHVFITGEFLASMDFDLGPGTDIHTSNGENDIFLTKFHSDGSYLGTRTWGGESSDLGRGLAVTNEDIVFVTGEFGGTVDFDPSSYGTDFHTAPGSSYAFLCRMM